LGYDDSLYGKTGYLNRVIVLL